MSRGLVDLRSDIVTRPTPAMRVAMDAAAADDHPRSGRRVIAELCERAAEIVGKEAATYVPSGTSGNELALRLLAPPGTEVLCPARAHLRLFGGRAARRAGVTLRPLDDGQGRVEAASVAACLAGREGHLPPVTSLCFENTHMLASGAPFPSSQVGALAAAARCRGLSLHCDGARLFNAAVALGVSAAELVAPVDTVMFCLNKGLAAPAGSILAGPADLLATAHHGSRSPDHAGIAAAGIVALATMVDRLAEDHGRARRIALALAERFPGSLDPSAVTTNIVCASTSALPLSFLDDLALEGVLVGTVDRHTVRLVTHHDVDDADVERTIAAFSKAGR